MANHKSLLRSLTPPVRHCHVTDLTIFVKRPVSDQKKGHPRHRLLSSTEVTGRSLSLVSKALCIFEKSSATKIDFHHVKMMLLMNFSFLFLIAVELHFIIDILRILQNNY